MYVGALGGNHGHCGHVVFLFKGYKEVQCQGAKAADEPGQMMDEVAFLTLALIGVLQKNTQTVCGVSQDDQRKKEI